MPLDDSDAKRDHSSALYLGIRWRLERRVGGESSSGAGGFFSRIVVSGGCVSKEGSDVDEETSEDGLSDIETGSEFGFGLG